MIFWICVTIIVLGSLGFEYLKKKLEVELKIKEKDERIKSMELEMKQIELEKMKYVDGETTAKKQ